MQKDALIGSLRESVSQLETEKQRLERKVADLGSETRQLEDRLVMEETHNDELTKRLDSARNLAKGQGNSELSSAFGTNASERDSDARRRAQPAAQPRSRRTPFAQIPNEIKPLPESRNDDFRRGSSVPRDADGSDSSELFPTRDSFGPQSRLDESRTRWLSIARGFDSPRVR